MQTIAFVMKLREGFEDEYRLRHNNIWPQLAQLLKEHGISDYSIFLNEETLDLFGVLKVEDAQHLSLLPQHAVMKKWWSYMKDIMETNADDSPVQIPLKQVFYLS